MTKRIAILGFSLESNRFAAPCGEADFRERNYFVDGEITVQARAEHPSIDSSICGFYAAMDRHCGGADGWQALPVRFAASMPAGPVEEAFFRTYLAQMREGLEAVMPVDGVYICEHGGACATHTHDPDGDVFEMVRAVVGPDVPVLATVDLHANVSDEMMDAIDVLIGYRTNPHIDLYERGEEAADLMVDMFAGSKAHSYRVRLPLVAPSVTQLTAEGHPYGDLIRLGQSKMTPDIMNVTILSGFAFCDTPKNGLTVIVTARDSEATAKALAIELATAGWADHQRYRTNMIALDDAAARAKSVGEDRSALPLLFADPADNPGGGGRGNTMYILEAFRNAGVRGCYIGVIFDPVTAAQAHEAGEGASIDITFNSTEANEFSQPFSETATVRRLSDGLFVGRQGMIAGKTVNTGPTAVLDIDGLTVIVITRRQQCLSTDYFEAFGLDMADARSVVVKSRGHFRAGFNHLFPPERIHEVDVPGLTSPNLADFNWRYLPRPVFPLDPETTWEPPAA